MKLKSFNFDEWIKDESQPVYTKDGKRVSNVTIFDSLIEPCFRIFGIIERERYIDCWRENGIGYNIPRDNDLMLVEKDILDDIEEFINNHIKEHKDFLTENKYLVLHEQEAQLKRIYNEGIVYCAETILEFIKSKKDK